MRRSKEPRGTIKPLCNITTDGNITNHKAHSITIDKTTRHNTVVLKNDITIATDTKLF